MMSVLGSLLHRYVTSLISGVAFSLIVLLSLKEQPCQSCLIQQFLWSYLFLTACLSIYRFERILVVVQGILSFAIGSLAFYQLMPLSLKRASSVTVTSMPISEGTYCVPPEIFGMPLPFLSLIGALSVFIWACFTLFGRKGGSYES